MTATQTPQTLWLTLANAFMPPMQAETYTAFRDYLADDLAALCADLDLDAGSALADLRKNLAKCATAQDLLVAYSHLFLQPPIPATLNLGRYVDGGINGPCLDALENAYRAAGIEQRETLRDLGDHAVMQMECLAWLIVQADGDPAICADDFARICLVGALPRFAAAIAAESPDSPYGPLARIAAVAIETHAEIGAPAETPKRGNRRHDTSRGVWRHCQACANPFAREKEIQIMARALEQAGLPADHLSLCPDCRDATQGFFRRSSK